jgi:ferritin-like metal-binding protein YciE
VAGVILGVLGVFLALVVVASGQATRANTQYIQMSAVVSSYKQEVNTQIQGVQSSFDTHTATQRATDKSVIEKLDEVKTELSEQRKEQRVLLERILELQIEVARRHAAAKIEELGLTTRTSGV